MNRCPRKIYRLCLTGGLVGYIAVRNNTVYSMLSGAWGGGCSVMKIDWWYAADIHRAFEERDEYKGPVFVEAEKACGF